jgi:hypothetical protein
MPFWTPVQALNFLTQRLCIEDEYGICCYNTIDKGVSGMSSMFFPKVKIQPLGRLLKNAKMLNDPNKGAFKIQSDLLYDYNKIISHEFSGPDMFAERKFRGYHVIDFDFEKGEEIDQNFQFSESSEMEDETIIFTDHITTLGKWALFQGSQDRFEAEETKDNNSNFLFTSNRTKEMVKLVTLND